jgi:hypothetical protein
MKWIKPFVRNDWGSITVHLRESMTPADMLKPGYHNFMWPNAETQRLEVKTRPYTRSVGDMGHSYDVTSQVPYVEVDHEGAKLRIDLWTEDCPLRVCIDD